MEMKQHRFLVNASVLLCLFGVVGCSGSTSKVTSQEAVTQVDQSAFNLALRHEIGQTLSYCLSTEIMRSVEFEGIRADNKKLGAFSSAMTGRLYDVTWAQRVQDLDPNGQALLSIKITGLGYKAFRVGELTVDYDSARARNAVTALEDLLGITYQVRLNTKGYVLEVMGAEQALARLDNNKADIQAAKHFISDAEIKTRHTVKALYSAPDQAVKQGTWTDSEAFSFGKMGSKRFDKSYTCWGGKEGTPLVEVSLKGTESPGRNLTRAPVPKMPLASKDQYIGMLVLDTETGQIKTYHETLAVDWVVEDAAPQNGADPRKIHMTQRQAFLLERKDVAQ